MRILSVHNHYRYLGGEDAVAQKEAAMLRHFGHEVIEYRRTNREIDDYSALQKAQIPLKMLWNRASVRELRAVAQREKPDVVHFHNTHFMISPAVYYAFEGMPTAVVRSLHNYRLLCPAATFFRDGQVCELCLESPLLLPALRYACYRDSRPVTAALAGTLLLHRWRKTWQEQVDAFIVLTEFMKEKFITAGFVPERLHVKPHFVEECAAESLAEKVHTALYVGRLSDEKGLHTLLRAWAQLPGLDLTLVGQGDLRAELEAFCAENGLQDRVRFLGQQSPEQVTELMRSSRFLIFPSECYETFGMTILEAYCSGLPVVASRLGSRMELVQHGQTGLLFTPGNADDLAQAVRHAVAHPAEMAQMGRQGQQFYREHFTERQNYAQLMAIYEAAQERRRAK